MPLDGKLIYLVNYEMPAYLNEVSHFVLIGEEVEAAHERQFVRTGPRDRQPVCLADLSVVGPVAF